MCLLVYFETRTLTYVSPLMLWIPSMICMLGTFAFFGVLITDEVGHMSLNSKSFDLYRYDAIVSGWYLKG